MNIFVFLLLFTMPSFGGAVKVRFEFQTLDGCQRIEKVVLRELEKNGMNKFTHEPCAEVQREPIKPSAFRD